MIDFVATWKPLKLFFFVGKLPTNLKNDQDMMVLPNERPRFKLFTYAEIYGKISFAYRNALIFSAHFPI